MSFLVSHLHWDLKACEYKSIVMVFFPCFVLFFGLVFLFRVYSRTQAPHVEYYYNFFDLYILPKKQHIYIYAALFQTCYPAWLIWHWVNNVLLQGRKSSEDKNIGLKPVTLRKASTCKRFEHENLEWKIENWIRLSLQFASQAGVYRYYNFSIK